MHIIFSKDDLFIDTCLDNDGMNALAFGSNKGVGLAILKIENVSLLIEALQGWMQRPAL